MLHRYHDIGYILQTDIQTGLELIAKAREKERDDRLFQQWVVQLPWMDDKSFIGFADYKNKVTGANIDRRSVAEIEAELADVERQLQRGGGS